MQSNSYNYNSYNSYIEKLAQPYLQDPIFTIDAGPNIPDKSLFTPIPTLNQKLPIENILIQATNQYLKSLMNDDDKYILSNLRNVFYRDFSTNERMSSESKQQISRHFIFDLDLLFTTGLYKKTITIYIVTDILLNKIKIVSVKNTVVPPWTVKTVYSIKNKVDNTYIISNYLGLLPPFI